MDTKERHTPHCAPRCESLEFHLAMSRRTKVLDSIYLLTALNLSGKREELERAAFELVQEHGHIKALRMSGEV